MNSTNRYRLYPTPAQERDLRALAAQARWAWNFGLERYNALCDAVKERDLKPDSEEWRALWRGTPDPAEGGPCLNPAGLKAHTVGQRLGGRGSCPHCRPSDGFGAARLYRAFSQFKASPGDDEQAQRDAAWLRGGRAEIANHAFHDLEEAIKRRKDGFGRPHWRSARKHVAFRIANAKGIDVAITVGGWCYIGVPKVGRVRFRAHAKLPSDEPIKSYRIKYDTSRRGWYLSFALKPDQVPPSGCDRVIGLDMGVANTIATSEGELLRAPGLRLTQGQQARRKRLERHLERFTTRENRWRDEQIANGVTQPRRRLSLAHRQLHHKLAALRAREAQIRDEWIEETTTRLAREYDVIVVEDLRVKAMSKSAKGTADKPGKNVRAKAGLNRGILANCWGRIRMRLEQKCGDRLIAVDPANTSRQCSRCGHIAAENRATQQAFACVACGHEDHADINAAKNIRDRYA